MIHVFGEKEFFINDLVPVPWHVSHSSIRVVIIIIMDHIIIIIDKWRSDAIYNDPRVWINHGSTMDQHGSTWIKRIQPARRGSRVMRPRIESVQRPDSWLMRPASGSWLMRPASGSWLMRPASTLHASGVHAPRVRRPRSTLHASGVRRPRSTLHLAPPGMAPGGISHRLDPLGQCPRNALH